MADEKAPEEKKVEEKAPEAKKTEEKVTAPPPPPPPSAPAEKASGKALAALILGIIGLLCCNLLGPVAWIIGSQEKKAIAQGESSKAGETMAQIGFILGIIDTVILILTILGGACYGILIIIAASQQ